MRRFCYVLLALALALPASASDWTGIYLGFSVAKSDFHGPGGLVGDRSTYGFHLGYDRDFGTVVLGSEYEIDNGWLEFGGGAYVERIERVKLRAGYDFGSVLAYAVLGGARADTSAGDDFGWVAGLGLAHAPDENVSLSAEYLHHEFDDYNNSGVDADADLISLRASWRF